MKIKELIKKLSIVDPESKILVSDGFGEFDIKDTEFYETEEGERVFYIDFENPFLEKEIEVVDDGK